MLVPRGGGYTRTSRDRRCPELPCPAPLTFSSCSAAARPTSYVLIDRSRESRGGRASSAPRTVAEPVNGIDGADPRPPSPGRGRETAGVPARPIAHWGLGRE